MEAGQHRARHAPHQFPDRQRCIRVGARVDTVGYSTIRAQAHRQEQGAEIAEQKRSVSSVVPSCKLCRVVFDQAGQGRREIEGCFGRAHPSKVIESPNDAGGAKVKTCGAIGQTILARMGRPEPCRVKIGEGVCDDLLDCRHHLGGVPGYRTQRHMG
jgi:hypothetical protein